MQVTVFRTIHPEDHCGAMEDFKISLTFTKDMSHVEINKPNDEVLLWDENPRRKLINWVTSFGCKWETSSCTMLILVGTDVTYSSSQFAADMKAPEINMFVSLLK